MNYLWVSKEFCHRHLFVILALVMTCKTSSHWSFGVLNVGSIEVKLKGFREFSRMSKRSLEKLFHVNNKFELRWSCVNLSGMAKNLHVWWTKHMKVLIWCLEAIRKIYLFSVINIIKSFSRYCNIHTAQECNIDHPSLALLCCTNCVNAPLVHFSLFLLEL